MTKSALLGWSSLLLDGESQVSEHPYGACLSALEVTGAKSLARGELISCAQDRLVRVMAVIPYQVVTPARAETMLREEPYRRREPCADWLGWRTAWRRSTYTLSSASEISPWLPVPIRCPSFDHVSCMS